MRYMLVQDPRRRPTIDAVVTKFRQICGATPPQASSGASSGHGAGEPGAIGALDWGAVGGVGEGVAGFVCAVVG